MEEAPVSESEAKDRLIEALRERIESLRDRIPAGSGPIWWEAQDDAIVEKVERAEKALAEASRV